MYTYVYFLSGDTNFTKCLIIANVRLGHSFILSDTEPPALSRSPPFPVFKHLKENFNLYLSILVLCK